MTIYVSDLVEDPDSLRRRLAGLEERVEDYARRHPTQAGEVLRLAEVAAEIRHGNPSRNHAAVSREDQAEIERLAKLSDEMRGGSPEAPAPATERKDNDPADADEIARLAAIAKERR